MTKKQEYLQALNRRSSEWIKLSAKNPSRFMTKTHIALHYIVLRRRNEL